MTIADFINGMFELCGGLFILNNCFRIHKDKMVKGISILSTVFFCSWGYWNLYFYPSLNQWISFCGGLLIVLTNTWWVIAALYYTHKNKKYENQRRNN